MLKKYCEYCGEKQSSRNSAHTSHLAHSEDELELNEFLHHFATALEEADDEDDEDEEFEEAETVKSSFRVQKIASITRRIDSVANALEKSGKKKVAFELDKISDMLDQYCRERGV